MLYEPRDRHQAIPGLRICSIRQVASK